MSSPARPSSKSAASASGASAPPIQFATKSSVASPKLNNEMEMGSLAADGQAGDDDAAVAVSPEKDIMQLARIGDIVAMEKLFESGEFDATYSDDEGITPLHVSRPASKPPIPSNDVIVKLENGIWKM